MSNIPHTESVLWDYLPTMSAEILGRICKAQVAGTSDPYPISSGPHQGPESLISLSRYLLIPSAWLTLSLYKKQVLFVPEIKETGY